MWMNMKVLLFGHKIFAMLEYVTDSSSHIFFGSIYKLDDMTVMM